MFCFFIIDCGIEIDRVFLFLFTDDFWRDYHLLRERDVCFVRPPQDDTYGTVAVFEDLYGNLWDLIEPNANNKGLRTTV